MPFSCFSFCLPSSFPTAPDSSDSIMDNDFVRRAQNVWMEKIASRDGLVVGTKEYNEMRRRVTDIWFTRKQIGRLSKAEQRVRLEEDRHSSPLSRNKYRSIARECRLSAVVKEIWVDSKCHHLEEAEMFSRFATALDRHFADPNDESVLVEAMACWNAYRSMACVDGLKSETDVDDEGPTEKEGDDDEVFTTEGPGSCLSSGVEEKKNKT